MAKYAKSAHKRIARCVGYALTLGNADAWADLALLFGARLTSGERAGVAYAALRSLDEQTAYEVASFALYGVHRGEVAQ